MNTMATADEIARFKRIVDAIERERANESALIMLGLLAMMLDGLETFFLMPTNVAVRAALDHVAKKRGEERSS